MKEKKTTKAQREASKRYMQKVERIQVTFPAGTKEDIKLILEDFGCKSVADFVRWCTLTRLYDYVVGEKLIEKIKKTN